MTAGWDWIPEPPSPVRYAKFQSIRYFIDIDIFQNSLFDIHIDIDFDTDIYKNDHVDIDINIDVFQIVLIDIDTDIVEISLSKF